MEVDPIDEVAFAGEVTAEERTAAAIKQAIDITDDDFDPRSLPVAVTQPPPPKRARVDNSAVAAPDFDSVASQSSAAASSSSAAVVVKEEKTAEAEAARQSEEAAWELSVWPDADGRKVNAPAPVNGGSANTGPGGATVVSFTEVIRGSDDGGNSNAIAAVEELGCDALRARFGGRVAALGALYAAPKQLVNVRGRVSPLVENGVYTPNSVELRVEVRFANDVVNASLAQRREGFCHAGLDAAIGALLLARQKGGEAIAGLPLKTKGVCVPPRAARLGAASLRTLRGQLKALETEGTAARPPPPPDGLSVNLGEYQVETVGWMLARETSKFGIEDLFETPLGSLAVTALPTPKEFTDKGKHIAEEVKAAARGKAQLSTTASAVSRPRHRGGILAEEMGMGKTIELLALFLSNRPPAGWKDEGNGVARRPETLVVVPNALGGQWDKEIRQRAPGLKAVPFNGGSLPPLSTPAAAAAAASSVLICTYNMVSQLPANAEWWRICLDEPHGNLRTTMMKGRIELSPEVVQCAALRGERRWCVTGTPLGNQLIDVYGQLVFLRLASADDSGRAGAPGLIPALHFRLQYAGTWQSEYMSTAEIIASILKPLTVRHTKTQSRNGEALLSLPPVHHNTVLIPPTDDEAAAYAAARAAAAEALAAGRHRLHAHAHALRPLTLLCSGVTGKLAEELEARQSGLTARKTSGAWRVHVKMPKQRDDFRFDATVVHSTDLYEWARSINVNREHDCASCLQRVTSLNGQGAVALAPCGHLLCVGCKDALLQTAQGAADCKTRERVGVRIHGPDGCFPDDCYLDGRQNEEGQAARATLRSYLMDRIRGIFPSKPIPQIEINVYYAGGNGNGDSASGCYAEFFMPTRELEDQVISFFNGCRHDDAWHIKQPKTDGSGDFGQYDLVPFVAEGRGRRAPHRPNNVALHGGAMPRLTFERATYTVQCAPCPAAGCNHRRFADFEVLDIHQTIEHPERTVWPAVVREFICAYKVRERRDLKASRRATRDQPARPPVIAASSSASSSSSLASSSSSSEATAAAGASAAVGGAALVGRRVRVWWEGDDCWYSGTIDRYIAPSHTSKRRASTGGRHEVKYDDGDRRKYDFEGDLTLTWEFEGAAAAAAPAAAPAAADEEVKEEEAPAQEAAADDDDVDDEEDSFEEEARQKAELAAEAAADMAAAAVTAADAGSKLRAVVQVVEAAAAKGERVVVFVEHSELTRAVERLLLKATKPAADGGRRCLNVHSIDCTTRKEQADSHVDGLMRGRLDALVLTLRFGSEGVNLQAANHVVFVTPCIDPAMRRQAIGRCHRIGQTKPVTVHHLAIEGTHEQKALPLLDKEQPARQIGGVDVQDQYQLRLAALADLEFADRRASPLGALEVD